MDTSNDLVAVSEQAMERAQHETNLFARLE